GGLGNARGIAAFRIADGTASLGQHFAGGADDPGADHAETFQKIALLESLDIVHRLPLAPSCFGCCWGKNCHVPAGLSARFTRCGAAPRPRSMCSTAAAAAWTASASRPRTTSCAPNGLAVPSR